MSAALFEFGILAPHRVSAWIALVGHEPKGFASLVESFDYAVPALSAKFDRRITPALVAQLGRQPGERMAPLERQGRIAAIVYAKLYGDGEAASGDG